MKIMYVDTSINGHHLLYLNHLLQAVSDDSFAVLPELTDKIQGRIRTAGNGSVRGFEEYGSWMKELRGIAVEEKPDIIHFLDGDSIMRHLGRGFARFRDSGIVITFHHLFKGKMREISMKRMLHYADAGVVHTENILHQIESFGCDNVKCVPYPCFLDTVPETSGAYRNEPPILLALGGTRYDKGLDILLNALKHIDIPFRLIIAGKSEHFDETFIRNCTEKYRDSVEICLHFLDDEEIKRILEKSDIIVLPYRKIFDGASGPMCEGIYLGKTIIGPAHGSLGEMIQKTHTGYTFESENAESLSECIEYALKNPCIYDEIALQAQRSLDPKLFAEKYMNIYHAIIH
ncbi:MAG TPA: glycosyltransferase family 4 protein [Candidatus Merdisoma merdipullorum]|nr:glycosyltransferase family 4 protein [Candidatus Merdisoma merdipullorum]